MEETIENVACTICGCVCDDLQITVEGGRITNALPACSLAEPWFASQEQRQPPAAEAGGRELPWERALDQAADILRAARSPLIYGLSRSSTDGQRAAARLADRIGATIDTTASLCHAPSIMALQQVGESTCTLGEIKNRADLVIYWGSNPAVSHPRHMERYATDPLGEFIPQGRADRTLVVADVAPTPSSDFADIYLPIEPGRDFEALWTLRALVRGIPLTPGLSAGAPLPMLVDLAQRMKSCRCGVLFFGLGLTRHTVGHRNVEALLQMVTELNAYTRFHARRMRVPGDVTGADNVLCWQTGYPFSVSLSRGYPRYNPGEYSANDMLLRREVDACLFVGSEGVADLSPAAVEHLQRIPTIALDYPTVDSLLSPTIRFTTAIYGIHLPGTAYRMDEVPIPLRAFLPAKYPSDADVLQGIQQRLG